MYDILVGGQVVAVCVEGLVKLFAEALVRNLGIEMSLEVRKHLEPSPEEPKSESKK